MRLRKVGWGILTTVIVAAAAAVSPAYANEPSWLAPERMCADFTANGKVNKARKSMMCLVSYARKHYGLRKYKRNRKLAWSAKRKAKDILRCNSFSHYACGRDFTHWIKRSRYSKWVGVAENIAWGSGSLGNVRTIFVAWMKSPPHRKAILDRKYKDADVNVVRGSFHEFKGARIWVMHFGSRIGNR